MANFPDDRDDYKAEKDHTRKEQQQADPQLTELRGFADSDSDLEPTLTDGTKAPEKAEGENAQHGGRTD